MGQKPALLDGVMIGEFMDRLLWKFQEASVIIHEGELMQEAQDGLVEVKRECGPSNSGSTQR